MRVFVTGASGWVGSAVVRELLTAGHQVVGLARSDASAAKVKGDGAEVHRGDLNDLDSLRAGAAGSDGVIHTAYDHAFTDYAAAAALDRRAIVALGEALAGSNRPLIITEGVQRNGPGQVGTEDSAPPAGRLATRGTSQKRRPSPSLNAASASRSSVSPRPCTAAATMASCRF